MDYDQSLSYLYGLGHEVLAAKFGLESMRSLLAELGNPERQLRAVIIAGTNGKGSTAAMLEHMARLSGFRTALYTSPHLVRIEERIQVCGQKISPDEFARLATKVREASESLVARNVLSAPPTFFEQVTAIAMLYFQERGAELTILEVGLGGRLDATNVVDPIAAVITSIDYDHQDILGHEITQIAAEKAAVIKPGARAIIAKQRHKAALEVLLRRCEQVGVSPVLAKDPTGVVAGEDGLLAFDYQSSKGRYAGLKLGLRGRHQLENAAAAIEAAEALSEAGFHIPEAALVGGLRDVIWPGRLELIDDRPRMLLDGAHNPSGAHRLRQYLDEFHKGHITLIFGAMKDKDIEGMASELFGAASTIVLTRVRDARAATGARMGKAALSAMRNVVFTEDVSQALSWARSITPPDGLICAAGSLHLIGEIKKLLEEENRQSVVM